MAYIPSNSAPQMQSPGSTPACEPLLSANTMLSAIYSKNLNCSREVEQLHKIFKLCGTPSEDYWKRLKVPTTFRPPHPYKPNLREAFRDFPSSLGLLKTLLSLDPAYRGSAASALQSQFFSTSPLACDLTGLPIISKDEDEQIQTTERTKSAKMRQRSKTQREHRRKDLATEIPKGGSGSTKEEQENNIESTAHSQEPSFGTTSITTSSSVKQIIQEDHNSPPLLFPIVSSPQKMPPKSEAHPNATKNIKNRPPLPNAKRNSIKYNKDTENMYKLSQVPRSVSTREFRKFDQEKFKLHLLDD